MKKSVKFLFYIFIVVFGFYIIWNFVYCNIVSHSLIEKNNNIENNWIEFIKIKKVKNEKTLNFINMVDVNKKIKDSLLFYIQNEFKEEKLIYKSPDLSLFIINEYYTNLYTMKLMNGQVLNDMKIKKFKSEMDLIIKKANALIEDYNNNVLIFNTYRSTFPNYFVANKLNLNNIYFFKIKYGVKNKNPKIKSNIEKWIESGDSTYLKIEQDPN